MAKFKVSLSIGYPTAKHEDVIEIPDEDLEECESQDERNRLIDDELIAWAWNYIEVNVVPVEDKS